MAYCFKLVGVVGVLFALGLHTLPAGGTACCTYGFPSLQQLMSATDTMHFANGATQGLYPALRIACDGNLTEMIYTATSGNPSNLEFFNVWRETSPGTNVYCAVPQAIYRESETQFARINDNIALYSVRVSNYSVIAGDFIAFTTFLPSAIGFLDHNDTGPGSIYTSMFMRTINLSAVAVASYDRTYFPLITVVIDPSSVACSSSQLLPTPTCSITESTTLLPTPCSINPTTSVSGNSRTVLIVTVAVVPSGVVFGLLMLLLPVVVIGVTHAIKSRKKEHHILRQSSGPEYTASREDASSDGDNCSMESNPTYGDPRASSHIQQHNNCSSREIMYHTLHFELKPRSELEEKHTVYGDSNYSTLQRLDYKPKYESESEYCRLANIPNSVNGAAGQKLEGCCGCDVTTLRGDSKSGEEVAEIEKESDNLNEGFNRAENCGAMVLNVL